MKRILQKIKGALKNAKNAILAVHIDPDGDAVGSMLGLGMMLEKKSLYVTYYSADGVPKIYKFLPGAEKIKSEIYPSSQFDLALVIDSSDLSRLGNKINLKQIASLIINIDHHPDNTNFGDINYIAKTSSVAEQIYELGKYLRIKMDKKIAECLYVAMITDTGNYRYENTSEKTFKIAAELLRAGISTHELTTRIYDTKSMASIRIMAKALSHLKISEDHKVAWASVTEEMMKEVGAKGEDLIGIVDQIRALDGVEVAILFRQDKNKVKINFRSKTKVNVSELAKHFGGGGHHKAAGAIIEGAIEDVEKKVISEVLSYLEKMKYLVL
ncbi:MAG: DHH family phosphoesterase [Candidatus Margulisiibacteriota bacterium]